jgi:DNA processing protein
MGLPQPPHACDDAESWLLLARTPGLSRRLNTVSTTLGDPRALLQRGPAARLSALGLSTAACRWLAAPDRALVQPALHWLAASPQHHLVCFGQPGYPPLLRQIDDPPCVLFVHGDVGCLSLPQVAIVGARGASSAALDTAHSLAAHLGRAGFAISSGLALGVDAAAHRGALEHGALTCAVLATGPERTYPREHASLAGRIARQGALVTEFPPGTPPARANFPRRNRIISGLSTGTVVVEAAEKSGSLITARLAAEQGREVFAVPGSIYNPLARGCHQLLRDGAVLVESAADVVAALPALLGVLANGLPAGLQSGRTPPDQNDQLPTQSVLIMRSLGYDPASIDDLVHRSGLTADRVCSILPPLELQGCVRRLPDGRYERVPDA